MGTGGVIVNAKHLLQAQALALLSESINSARTDISFGGSAVHTNRLLVALKEYVEQHFDHNVSESLGNHSWLIACFDNGQDGLPLRY